MIHLLNILQCWWHIANTTIQWWEIEVEFAELSRWIPEFRDKYWGQRESSANCAPTYLCWQKHITKSEQWTGLNWRCGTYCELSHFWGAWGGQWWVDEWLDPKWTNVIVRRFGGFGPQWDTCGSNFLTWSVDEGRDPMTVSLFCSIVLCRSTLVAMSKVMLDRKNRELTLLAWKKWYSSKASNRNNPVAEKVIKCWRYLAQARCKP